MVSIGLLIGGVLQAAPSPLLVKAVEHWDEGRRDLAFTQHTTQFGDKDEVVKTWVERYDPSLPDNQRWKLIELNGKQPTDAERTKWESKKNNRPRKKATKSLSEYLNLDDSKLIDENDKTARFEISIKPEAARLVAIDKLSVIVTVDKAKGDIAHIAALLREPMKIALGLAKVTDVDLDVHVEPDSDKNKDSEPTAVVKPGSTAKVLFSKFGNPVEYKWSDFKRVTAYGS